MLSDLRPCAGNVCDAENMALACATHASLICHARLYDRGIKRARFVVIRDITIPGVLIEGGFLSNPEDARLIATPQYREEEAQCIAIAVRNYRNAVNAAAPLPPSAGSSVVVRDDMDAHGAPAATPEPIGEPPAPAAAAQLDVATAGVPAATPSPAVAPVKPAPAPPTPVAQAPKAAASPESQPPAQAQNEAVPHSFVTPIVD
jgi:hypothetical protein